MGRNKGRNPSSYKTGELTRLWKSSSLFIACLALMPTGKMDFTPVVLQTNPHLQKTALQHQQAPPAR